MDPTLAKVVCVFLTIVLAAAAYRPLNMVIIYLIFRPLVQPYAALQYTLVGGLPITAIFSLVMIIVATVTGVLFRANKIIEKHILILFIFIYWTVVSLFGTLSYAISLAHIIKLATGLAIYMLVYNGIKSQSSIKLILNSIVLSSILPMLYGYYQFITNTGHSWKGEYYTGSRIDSFLYEYNAYGEYLCIVICSIIVLLLWEKHEKRHFILYTILGSLGISLILSLNRGSWIALTLGIIISALAHGKYLKLRYVIVPLCLVGLVFGSLIVGRFQELQDQGEWGSKNTFDGRVDGWKRFAAVMKDRPFGGYGIGTSPLISELYFKTYELPHNDYLRISVEAGPFSGLLYTAFLFQQLFSFFARRRDYHSYHLNFPLLIMVIYYIIISLTQNVMQNMVVFPMFLSLLAVGLKSADLGLFKGDTRTPSGDCL